MKFYGKKFLKNSMQKAVERKTETRDAIMWEVHPSERYCDVKIQGSNQKITTHYPENWEKTPFWLKPGNAVRITHMGGVRGRIEVVSHGQLVPTPVSGNTFPTPVASPNCVLTGCNLIECATPRMAVLVLVGTYRIGGVDYTLGPITMQYGTNYQLDDGGTMGEIAGAVAIDAAPAAGNYRYDLVSVGIDGVIDYTAGTPSANPVEPTLEANHIQIVPYIFIPSGTTEILNGLNIGGKFSTPAQASLSMVIADNDLAWAELSTTVTVTVNDQYGHGINGTGYGWYLTLEIIQGNGTISSPEEGSSTTKIGGHTGANSSYVFTYTRDQLDPGDSSPVLQAALDGSRLSNASYIILRDAGGSPM